MKAFDNYVNAIAIELGEMYWYSIECDLEYIRKEGQPTFQEWLIKENLAFEVKDLDYVAIDHTKAVLYLLKDVYKNRSHLYNYSEEMTFEEFLHASHLMCKGKLYEKEAIEFIIDSVAIAANEPVLEYREWWAEWWGV